MAERTSYIKLDRNILRWRWWKDHNTVVVFLYLLLSANVTDHDFRGEIIHRGQVVTSIKSIASQADLSISKVRVALEHLKMTGEIASESTNRYQVITIVNYDKYQSVARKDAVRSQPDRKQIASRSQRYKNIKNDKNEKNEKGRSAPEPPSGADSPSAPVDYPFKCGLYTKPDWMTDEEWVRNRDRTANEIPALFQGEYDSIMDYLHDHREGLL